MIRLIFGILLIIISLLLLSWFSRPSVRKKMRDRQRSGRKTFEEMSRKQFGEAYSRLLVIPAGLGNIYIEIILLAIILLAVGISLICSAAF